MVCVPIIKAVLADDNQLIYKIETQVFKKSYYSALTYHRITCKTRALLQLVLLLDGNQLILKMEHKEFILNNLLLLQSTIVAAIRRLWWGGALRTYFSRT